MLILPKDSTAPSCPPSIPCSNSKTTLVLDPTSRVSSLWVVLTRPDFPAPDELQGMYTVGQITAFIPASTLPDIVGRRYSMFMGNLCLWYVPLTSRYTQC